MDLSAVTAASTMLRIFSEADSAYGAGHMRSALVEYLKTTVEPLPAARATSPAVRREFLTVAAQLSYLCGFMCFDDQLHDAAQARCRTALGLAAEANDPDTYAIALRAMSVQAHAVGHCRPAVELAESAVGAASVNRSPEVQAFVAGQLAVAHAVAGNRRAPTAGLVSAERHFERATSSHVIGVYRASLAHQRAVVHIWMENPRAAVSSMKESIRSRPATEARSKVITLARLAELKLRAGQVEQAVRTWHRSLDGYPMIRSGRATTALGALRSCLRPYRGAHELNDLLDRASALEGRPRRPAG
ncbi:hypothetical protein [Lentzea roselyniae]|uniref:hypothetical protein n=1 Tax=Lentzea roselyniae TaxID=531940 RepID=UPI0031F72B94